MLRPAQRREGGAGEEGEDLEEDVSALHSVDMEQAVDEILFFVASRVFSGGNKRKGINAGGEKREKGGRVQSGLNHKAFPGNHRKPPPRLLFIVSGDFACEFRVGTNER